MKKLSYVDKILFTKKEIDYEIKKIASLFNLKYSNSKDIPVFIVILNGAIPFFAKLISYFNFVYLIDSIRISSYFDKEKSDELKITKDIELEIKNKHVYIVDEIFDTGKTFNSVYNKLKNLEPKVLKTIALLKKENNEIDSKLEIDYYCFKIDDQMKDYFLIGFGLDYKQLYRHLPYIASYNKKYQLIENETNELNENKKD